MYTVYVFVLSRLQTSVDGKVFFKKQLPTNMAIELKPPIFNRRYIFNKRSVFCCHVSLLEGILFSGHLHQWWHCDNAWLAEVFKKDALQGLRFTLVGNNILRSIITSFKNKDEIYKTLWWNFCFQKRTLQHIILILNSEWSLSLYLLLYHTFTFTDWSLRLLSCLGIFCQVQVRFLPKDLCPENALLETGMVVR